jgi:hypothetical protein
MENKINNNFGGFGLSGGHEVESKYKNEFGTQKSTRLNAAIKEIELGTPDAIGIAAGLLKLEKIEIPPLNTLLELHQRTSGKNLNKEFYQKCGKLQAEAIEQIKNFL